MRRRESGGNAASVALPRPRGGGHDLTADGPRTPRPDPRRMMSGTAALWAPRDLTPAELEAPAARRVAAPVPTGLPGDVERRLAQLAGVAAPPVAPDLDGDIALAMGAGRSRTGSARRLLRVAEGVTFGAFVLLVISALLAARYGSGLPHVRALPFAAWGLGAAVSALTLAVLAGDSYVGAIQPVRRRVLGAVLLLSLLGCVTGVVTNAAGAAGPAWVLFLPVVLVAGAVTGPARGLLIGAGAATGLYVAAVLSDTLTVSAVGRLVVLLPAFPAVGWSAGALARLARDAAREADDRRQALEADVRRIADVLDRVAEGDLAVVPAPGEDADPVTTSLAVAFADTLLALRRLLRQMDSVGDQLAASAVDLAGAAEQEANAVESQVAAVTETTTTIEQLAATAATIADTAVRVSQFAGSTRRDVDAGAAAVEDATVSMHRIADRVGELDLRASSLRERIVRIAETTRSIDDLARRTSVLAINASIEAARAGDRGSGFDTVATEVATLATRAREATARIGDVVAELEQEAEATAEASREGHYAVSVGAALQDEVVAALARISAMVDRTTLASREITEATRQQRFASEAVVSAMTTVTSASDRYRAGSRRHAESAARLRDLAETLRTSLGRFKIG